MKPAVLMVSSLFIFYSLAAQERSLKKEKWHWGNAQKQDTAAGYTQALKAGNTLYISGTVALDITEEGIKSVYTSLQKTLAAYGLTFENVVKENLYTTDIEAMKRYNYVRKRFYKGDFPAATWVQISRLYMPDAKLEIELVAQFKNAAN
ncbi:MAG: Rid family hydrolase [Flavihumibacter sp.]|nr:Rid family hydrolase [Flavihumibacter sp.]